MPPFCRNLIADDDQVIRGLLQAFLERRGYELEAVPDGRAALDQITSELPGLLLTDLIMSGLTEWSALNRIRATAPWVPAVVISGTVCHARLTFRPTRIPQSSCANQAARSSCLRRRPGAVQVPCSGGVASARMLCRGWERITLPRQAGKLREAVIALAW